MCNKCGSSECKCNEALVSPKVYTYETKCTWQIRFDCPTGTRGFSRNAIADADTLLNYWQQRTQPEVPGASDGPGTLETGTGDLTLRLETPQAGAFDPVPVLTYDKASQAIAGIDPLLNRTTTVYDLAGRAVASVDPLSHRTSTVYDAASRNIASVDPLLNRNTCLLYTSPSPRDRG